MTKKSVRGAETTIIKLYQRLYFLLYLLTLSYCSHSMIQNTPAVFQRD